jgi:hypothetical protein
MDDAKADARLLVQLYPHVFHVTDLGNAEGIMRHGLRSTHQVLDLFQADLTARSEALGGTRRRSIPLSHPELGHASVRDQLPLSMSRLATALTDMTVEEWLHRLNSLVFFWPTIDRVCRLLRAPVYAERDHHVLTVDTAGLVARHGSRILLAPINTGATRPFAHPRGRDTFLPLGQYPLADRRGRVGRAGAVAEITVKDAVLDIGDLVLRVERWRGPKPVDLLWERS